jgi:hypothetical protein
MGRTPNLLAAQLRLAALRQKTAEQGIFTAKRIGLRALEGLGLNFSVLLEQYLHFAFSFFEFLAAGT